VKEVMAGLVGELAQDGRSGFCESRRPFKARGFPPAAKTLGTTETIVEAGMLMLFPYRGVVETLTMVPILAEAMNCIGMVTPVVTLMCTFTMYRDSYCCSSLVNAMD
jgi:hypothetical protein